MTTAPLGLTMENAQLATKVTKLIMVNAFCLRSEAQLTLVVKHGTGMLKNALNAHSDGFSIEMASALLLTIIALPGLLTANVPPAIQVMQLIMENVKFITFCVKQALLMEIALRVTLVMFFTANNVFLSLNWPT